MDQGLPISFDNTATTWQTMPMYAAMQTGQQNRIAQENIAALQKAFEAEQAYKAQTRPVELQNLIRSGALTEAQARHADALSRLTGLSSDKAKAVMPGEIASTNAKNQTEVVNANQQQHAIQTTRYAAWLEAGGNKMPKFMQAQKFMETFGVDPKHGDEVLQNIPKLVQMIPQEARKLYELSTTGQQTAQKEAGDTARNTATNAANIRGHEISAGAIRDAAASRAATKTEDFLSTFRKIKKASDRRAALITEAARIRVTDPETSTLYSEMADDPRLVAQVKAELAAGGQATVSQGTNGPTLGTRQDQVDLGAGNPPPSKPGHSLADVRKLYPGISDEQLKKAYKDKFGVDLQ